MPPPQNSIEVVRNCLCFVCELSGSNKVFFNMLPSCFVWFGSVGIAVQQCVNLAVKVLNLCACVFYRKVHTQRTLPTQTANRVQLMTRKLCNSQRGFCVGRRQLLTSTWNTTT